MVFLLMSTNFPGLQVGVTQAYVGEIQDVTSRTAMWQGLERNFIKDTVSFGSTKLHFSLFPSSLDHKTAVCRFAQNANASLHTI